MRRPVGYVSFLALIQLITLGNFAALQLANAAVFSLTAPIMYLLVRRVVENSLVAAVTGLAVIHWPSFIYYERTLYSETATLPLFTLYLTLIPRGSILTTDPIKGQLSPLHSKHKW
jgi:dolichyl-phosphate-mannose--protein O-mannosyl transferase